MEAALAVAVLLFALGVGLLLHHGYKHAMDEDPDALARKESCITCCFFQLSDISNHETWILVCFTNSITILLMRGATA